MLYIRLKLKLMKTKVKNPNPFNICTLDENAGCASCSNHGKISCKFDVKIKNNFRTIGTPAIFIPILGMAIIGYVSGTWWPLITYPVYFLVMFNVFEIRFLCSHCPYYPDDNKTLVCLGNHGSPKLWKYHPEPMNKFEKFMMNFGVIAMIFFILPLSGLGYGIWYLSVNYAIYGLIPLLGIIALTIGSLLASQSFVSTVKTFYCNKCVNFSCPLNTVPKPIVDDYLRKNKVMREAWEKSGYKLDNVI